MKSSNDYIDAAMKTESCDFEAIAQRLSLPGTIRLLHGAMGLATEAGEFVDALKKSIFYGKELDYPNLREELGDLFWYLAIICDEVGTDFEEIMQTNIQKLKTRYGDKFTEQAALARNLEAEREVLEG